MKSLIITEEEKSRILGMHKSATARQYLMEAAITGVALDLINKINNYLNQTINNYKTKNPNVTINNFETKTVGNSKTTEGEFPRYTIYVGQNDLFIGSKGISDADLQATTNRDTNLKMYRNVISNAFNPTNLAKTAPSANKNLNMSTQLQTGVLKIFDSWAVQFQTKQLTQPGTGKPVAKTPQKP